MRPGLYEAFRQYIEDFNPRTHRGVRQIQMMDIMAINDISIHAPIVGCDFFTSVVPSKLVLFQSTHPSWGATTLTRKQTELLRISIHAPIVGCDVARSASAVSTGIFQSTHPSWGATRGNTSDKERKPNFNPRTHRGVRLISSCDFVYISKFQSTHPSWGATILY